MINFFRRIRQRLLTKNKFSKYLLYAIGEVFLVVIGILIALSINNWNERQRTKREANEIYQNLRSSLIQDSISVQQIIDFQTKSLETQRKIIFNGEDQLQIELKEQNLDSFLLDITLGAFSFFPKDGVYNLIVSNNKMNLIKSNEIKTSLTNLYEYQLTRYENIDNIVDHKFQFQIDPLLRKKMGFIVEFSSGIEIVKSTNPELFKEYYSDLSSECKDIFSILSAGKGLLEQSKKSITELLQMIRIELEK